MRTSGLVVLLAIAMPLSSPVRVTAQPSTSVVAPALVSLLVPAGSAVPVHVVGSISSGSAKAGDVFAIQAAEDVVVDAMVVIRKGAEGQGHIADTDSAGGNGHSGALALAFDYIHGADGGLVKLSDSLQKQTEEDRKGASSTATIIGFATFGLGGLFGHNFAHGREKTIDEKTVMSAFVADNVHVQTGERAVSEQFDH